MYGNSSNGSHLYKKNSSMDLDQVVTNSCRFMVNYGLCFSIRCFFIILEHKCYLYSVVEIGYILFLLLCIKHKWSFGLETSFQMLEAFINNGFLSYVSFHGTFVLCFALEAFRIPSSPLYTSRSLTMFFKFFIWNFILFLSFPQSLP